MLLSLALVLLVSLAASRAMKDAETLQSEMFPPTHPNCTQSLTDYLLLRQELQLSKMAAAEEERTQLTRENLQVLTQVRDTLSQVSEALTQRNQASGRSAAETRRTCDPPFSSVGDSCLLLNLRLKEDWASARQFCVGKGADLARFSDAAGYAAILDYINKINSQDEMTDVWVGGTDEALEGTWLWVTGELMPQGPPFWGSSDGYKAAPDGGSSQNCAGLYKRDNYYLHDFRCNGAAAPLCQK
ncbi:tetranectin-like [Penaeus indicus]|uniref:tetranectin-like n=1 Tax=Penaeus indicus TaxID=29960 RepID=UPI00300CBD9C